MTTNDYEHTLTTTGRTIEHRGRLFRILTTTDPRADSPYVLRPASGRGTDYALMRNDPRPDRLFGVSLGKMQLLPGWFRETAPGDLKSLG